MFKLCRRLKEDSSVRLGPKTFRRMDYFFNAKLANCDLMIPPLPGLRILDRFSLGAEGLCSKPK